MSVAEYLSKQLSGIRSDLSNSLDMETHEMISSIYNLMDKLEFLDDFILENVSD